MKNWLAFILKLIGIGAAAAGAAAAAGGSGKQIAAAGGIAILSNAVGQFQENPVKGY